MKAESLSNSATDYSRFLVFFIGTLALKILVGLFIPLSADESYYWVWSFHPALSYFDHPPMVSYWFWLGRHLIPEPMAVRIVPILLGHLTLLVWYRILIRFFPNVNPLKWLLLFFVCPMTGLGGIVITPDLPLLLFWSLAIYFALSIRENSRPRDFAWFGLFLGLGFCSKYHIVLLALAGLALMLDPGFRKAYLRPALGLTFLIGLLSSLPVLIWNAGHEWASFKFQLAHGLKAGDFNPIWPAEYALGQLLLISPPVLYFALRGKGPYAKALLWLSWFPLGFFLFSSFRAPVELNWPIMVYPAIFPLAVPHLGRRALIGVVGFWITLQVAILAALFFPARFHLHEKLAEPVKYRSLANLPRTHAPLFATTYQMASSMWYASGIPVYKLRGMTRPDMFDFWDGSVPSTFPFYLLKFHSDVVPESFRGYVIRKVSDPAPDLELLEVSKP